MEKMCTGIPCIKHSTWPDGCNDSGAVAAGGPWVPGYMPRMLSTSRKFSPIARTFTCRASQETFYILRMCSTLMPIRSKVKGPSMTWTGHHLAEGQTKGMSRSSAKMQAILSQGSSNAIPRSSAP